MFDLKLVVQVATFPLNSIVVCLGLTTWAFARGGTGLRSSILGYLLWIAFDTTPRRGGYELFWKLGITRWLRAAPFWRWGAEYFPVTLQATAKLVPEKGPYIFVAHPHGIFGVSPMANFGTEATGFSSTFPGIRVHLLGHDTIFRVPVFREWCLMHGHGTVDKRTCLELLGRGESIALAPGGAKESLESSPGTMRLYLRQRKGFVKLALRTGATLVPVLGFGENDVYSTVTFARGSVCRRVQDGLQSLMGFALPVFWGLSWLPWVPRRSPVRTVVGAPLRPPQPNSAEPTEEQVSAFHAEYCEALRTLWDSHKAAHGMEGVELELI